MAIRDAVNRSTRKPFAWGGLAGYQQLEPIDQTLTQLTSMVPESAYFRQLSKQVKRTLKKNRSQANTESGYHPKGTRPTPVKRAGRAGDTRSGKKLAIA